MTPKSLLSFTALCASLVLGGCDIDPSVAPVMSSPDSLFWTLRIDYPAVRLSTNAPYDTVRLSAVPYTAVGTVIDTTIVASGNTTWYSTDSTLVRVSSTGIVSARGATGAKKIYVVARRQVDGITREDRAMIQVVNMVNPPVLGSFRSRPADSLKRASGTLFVMVPRLLDLDGAPLVGYPVHYRSSNTIVASATDPWSGVVSAGNVIFLNAIGTSMITASTMAFGAALVDTFTVEVGYSVDPPLAIPMVDIKSKNGTPTPYLVYPSVDIGPGGVVGFTNGTGINAAKVVRDPSLTLSNGIVISYIFDDSLNVKNAGARTPTADGNILAISGDTFPIPRNRRHFRKFPFPGRYEYTVEPYGFRGVVIVHDR